LKLILNGTDGPFDNLEEGTMSAEAIIQFAEHATGNAAIEAEVNAIKEQTERQAESMSALAAKHGYAFTPEEFVTLNNALLKANQGELSEVELDSVAGGVAGFYSEKITSAAVACVYLKSLSDPKTSP